MVITYFIQQQHVPLTVQEDGTRRRGVDGVVYFKD